MFLFLLFPLLSLTGLSSQCEISVKNVGQVCIVHYVKVRFSRLRYCRTDSFPFFSLIYINVGSHTEKMCVI